MTPTWHCDFSPLAGDLQTKMQFSLSVLLTLFCSLPPAGLSPAGALGGDSDPSRGGEANHPKGQEPATAPVWPARLWMCPPHPGGQPSSHRPSLQQLQRTVPEQFGRLRNASLSLAKSSVNVCTSLAFELKILCYLFTCTPSQTLK